MKELTIEEKAEAYDKAIERARKLYNSEETSADVEIACENIFPELIESEDEKIRKTISDILLIDSDEIREILDANNILMQDIDTWLEKQSKKESVTCPICGWEIEKQGEQKTVPDWMPKFLDELRSKKNYFDWNEHKDIEGGILAIIKWMNPNYFNGKDGESKLVDKVEPKFKVGDFIVNDYCAGKVIALTDDAYLLDTGQGIPFSYEHNAHLWTIKDAKDGDVLYSLDSKQPFIFKHRKANEQAKAYCGINIYGKFFVGNTKDCIITTDKYIPATKEQRDTLMKAMADAGYIFDFDKKELKEIEHSLAWSEEDERVYKGLHNLIYSTPYCDSRKKLSDWLKSLKDRVQPKIEWNEEDKEIVEALNDYVKNLDILFSEIKIGDKDILSKEFRDKVQHWLKTIRPQNNITDEELAQAKKDAYNNALDKIEYHSGEPTFDDGWSAAIWHLKKRNTMPQSQWKPSEEQMKGLRWVFEFCNTSHQTNVLKELYEQLKQL